MKIFKENILTSDAIPEVKVVIPKVQSQELPKPVPLTSQKNNSNVKEVVWSLYNSHRESHMNLPHVE